MPIIEPIANTAIPKQVEKPIPTRTATTIARRNINQPITPDAPAPDAAPETVRLSPQLSALARKEQAFRQRELAFQKREQELEARLAEADQYSQLKSKLSAKDYSEAERLGLSYEGYTEYLLNKQTGEDPAQQKFKSLEGEVQALKQSQEDKATQEYEETVAEYRTALTGRLDSPEFERLKKFSDVNSEGKEFTAIDVALQLILDSWNEDNTEVTIDEALKYTDQFITERAKKFSALMEDPKPVDQIQPPRGPRTLTNNMEPQSSDKRPYKSLQHLAEQERYAEARRRVVERQQKG